MFSLKKQLFLGFAIAIIGLGAITISLGLFFSTPADAAKDSLVGYWSFDKKDGVKDLSGKGNNGIIKGDPKLVKGKAGDALEFDGVDDYVEVPDNPSISELNELSLSAWIKPTRAGGPWTAVIEKAVHQNWSYGFFIEPDATLSFEVSIGKNNNLVCCVGDFKVSAGNWYHIACVYDGKSAKLYVDGKLEGEMPASGSVHTTPFPLTIGCRNGQNFFAGAIDEVTFWDKAVALEEMKNPGLEAAQPQGKLSTTWAEIKKEFSRNE